MSKIVIKLLRSREIDDASVLLSRAFVPTPLPRAVFGDPSEGQRRIIEAGMKNMIANMPGKVFLAKEKNLIVGVMRIVEWPDCQKPPEDKVFKLLPEEIAFRFGKWRSIWAKNDPKKPHWHLDPLGVLPERQGQGIGSLLLKHFCKYVDKLRVAAYLETDQKKNVYFYSRFGFMIVGETSILNVHNWFMWRPPLTE
jgi:GNAT superfamily N-acetyltransferase